MDSWGRDQYREKPDMSSHATLSPSPFSFGHMAAPPTFASIDDSPLPELPRRRLSHPHNQSGPPRSNFLSPDLSPRFYPRQRPSLEHRTSQTIIDLTDDSDIPNIRRPPAGDFQRPPQRPPQLERSDMSMLADLIDLTEDGDEDDIEITHSRTLAVPAAPPQVPRHWHRTGRHPGSRVRDESPLFVPRDRHRPHHSASGNAARQIINAIPLGFQPRYHDHHFQLIFGAPDIAQQMPAMLDYNQHAFVNRGPQVAKPVYQAPPEAMEGFTRSPGEDDVIICPSCNEELITNPAGNEYAVVRKPGNKAPNKRDREEHPFWVVKECGHVYCNKCFQGRKTEPRFQQAILNPPKKPSPVCCVDSCSSDLGSKGSWVGVFL